MPQFSYTSPIATLGQLGEHAGSVGSLIWPLLAQETVVAVGGTTDGTYTIRVEGDQGTFDSSFVASGNTAAEITEGLAAALADNVDLLNILTAQSDGVSEVSLFFIHPGLSYTVSFPSNPGGNLSVASQINAGGDRLPLGVGVVNAGGGIARLPTTGDVALDIEGIVCRNADQLLDFALQQPAPGFGVGSQISALMQGTVWVQPETAVSVNDPVYCRVVATGSEQAGALRNDADGGDAVLLPGRFETSAAAGGFARVRLNMP